MKELPERLIHLGDNPMQVGADMTARAATVLQADYQAGQGGDLARGRFAELSLRMLNAALTDTRWEDGL